MKYRVTICREYWGYVDVEADTQSEAKRKVEEYEYEGEFVITKIGEQSVYNANPVENEERKNESNIKCNYFNA